MNEGQTLQTPNNNNIGEPAYMPSAVIEPLCVEECSHWRHQNPAHVYSHNSEEQAAMEMLQTWLKPSQRLTNYSETWQWWSGFSVS